MADGKPLSMPTIADIQGQREWLSPGETRALIDAVSNTTQRNDQMVQTELAGLVDSLPPGDFQARIAREVSEPRLGEIRLQWWRETVTAIAEGEDVADFLQGLVTDDMTGALPAWTALLTPQGKALPPFPDQAQHPLGGVFCLDGGGIGEGDPEVSKG